ncbi:hypothetical protein M1B74_07870 [Bacteroides pyogenes]|uniref:hypothetical protein n=1 Tax=Bacteroides pyogenes TaxID=310300 RepID=UPI003B42D7BB
MSSLLQRDLHRSAIPESLHDMQKSHLFEYTSGTTVKGKARVNPLADKKIKAMLHLTAINAIRTDKELKGYYQRKKKEGKHSLLVLNNVKFKLIGRIFATVNKNTKFVNTIKFPA